MTPLYSAVMSSVPTASAVVAQVAVPAVTALVAQPLIGAVSAKNATVPDAGVPIRGSHRRDGGEVRVTDSPAAVLGCST